jgi:hypothetical protein
MAKQITKTAAAPPQTPGKPKTAETPPRDGFPPKPPGDVGKVDGEHVESKVGTPRPPLFGHD